MILYHATSFGSAERPLRERLPQERKTRSVARARAAVVRVREWLPGAPAHSLVLTTPAAVGWACGGLPPPVDRTAGVDLVWAVITADSAALVTTNVEADRIRDEFDPAAHGFSELVTVPWQDPGAFVGAAEGLAGAPAPSLASDGHPAFGCDAGDDLVALRLRLSAPEREELADLGYDATAALQDALRSWRPGERDVEIQARCAAGIEAAGADAPVLIVGGDERLERYRHPMAAGVPVQRLVMAVVVARRAGLHAAVTRFAAAPTPGPAYAALRRRVLAVEDATLNACRPGRTYGTVLATLDAAYTAAGAPGGWTGHYQGGPIGYAQREFEIAPGQSDSRWYRQPVEAGHAIAWNPSLPGGAKTEDTYLVTDDGRPVRLTEAPDWPVEADDERQPPRPAVLEVVS